MIATAKHFTPRENLTSLAPIYRISNYNVGSPLTTATDNTAAFVKSPHKLKTVFCNGTRQDNCHCQQAAPWETTSYQKHLAVYADAVP